MTRFFAVLVALILAPLFANAQCSGVNLIDTMAEDKRAALNAATDAAPYPQGNLWRVTKDGAEVTIIGTYHMGDVRHDPVMNRIAPLIADAKLVLVEAGPREEAALMEAMASDPSLMLITEGPSLLEQLPPDEWEALAEAMRARSIPPFMAAKFKPWYVSMMLGIPACILEDGSVENLQNGLDKMVMAHAEQSGVPVSSLESYDTIFKMFGKMTPEQQLDMIRSTLLFEDQSESLNMTLADSYFSENSRRIWEFMRQISREMSLDMEGYDINRFEEEFTMMEEAILNSRNRDWIPVIESAAAEGPVFVAFGALHLSGEDGVLNLLDQAGWAVERLPIQ